MHIIRILMDYTGIRQAELSERTDVTNRDLGDMIHKPPFGQITKYQKVADFFGVPVHALVNNDVTRVPASFFAKFPHGAYLPCPNSKTAILGRQGEEAVFQMEQDRLMSFSESLSKLVIPYFKIKGKSPGYDILSFSDDGRPVAVEVKCSNQIDNDAFHLTKHEQEAAERLSASGIPYKIYFFTGWGSSEQKLTIVDYKELKEENRVKPSSFVCNLQERTPIVNGILYHRLIHKLSQVEVANRLEILPGNLCRYETGMYVCPVDVYQRLAELFCTSIDDLLKSYPRPEVN